jgi:hypothetical protein
MGRRGVLAQPDSCAQSLSGNWPGLSILRDSRNSLTAFGPL